MSGFKVTARTIFHLGSDLISSDAVALYELVKNAFDAGSESVQISIEQRVPTSVANPIIAALATAEEVEFESDDEKIAALEVLRERIETSLPEAISADVRSAVAKAGDFGSLLEAYLPINEITVTDFGDGMSLDELTSIFLTIGTTSRKAPLDEQRSGLKPIGDRPILGEKGVGRLSAMRLGNRLRVETARSEDTLESLLDIDWSLFEREPDLPLESITFTPRAGLVKGRKKGTTIRIFGLSADWSWAKLDGIAKAQFARLSDPFADVDVFPIEVKFNNQPVTIPSFRGILLDHAHAVVQVNFGPSDPSDVQGNGQVTADADMRLRGTIDYRLRRRVLPVDLAGIHLRNVAGVDEDVLRSLGAFKLSVYWFNRQALEKIDGIGDLKQVRDLVKDWSGGVMVYRDGFRVGAYGQGADDWLDLDRKALASGGYKVNRAQIVGRVSISSVANPKLVDQTNREGLRDSPEKAAFVGILKHVLENIFRPFLDRVDSDIAAREPVDLSNVADRVLKQRRSIANTLRLLYQRYPQVKSDPDIGGRIDESMNEIGELMRSLEEMGVSYRRGRTEMTVLAGIGLSVASIAHELRQATNNALELVDGLRRRRAPPADVSAALAPLGAQLKTLLTRLRVLDPLVTSGRQIKTRTDMVEWVTSSVQSAMPVFEASGIRLELNIVNRGDARFEVTVVQGMVVQVVGNLLDNARYWVTQAKLEDPTLAGRVIVEVDVPKRLFRVSDNGPGVPDAMRDTIFDAFVSTKPVGDGLGLGLYIAREIASYSGAQLSLEKPEDTPAGMATSFALRFEGSR